MDDNERRFLDEARVALAGGADMNEDYNSRAPEYPHANITRTRLYFAAIYGWCLAIEWLINTGGADPNYRNRPRHFVPLQCAVDRGHSRAVALLLDMGAGLDAFNGAKYPPLHLAVLQGNSSMVKLLLGRGASLDTQNRYGDDAEAYARVNPRIAVLLADVRAAGGWKRYVREPEFSMLLLRYLCLRGRATPPASLARVFGPPPIPNAGKARTRSRRLASSCASTPLPEEIFRHVLAFWNPRTHS